MSAIMEKWRPYKIYYYIEHDFINLTNNLWKFLKSFYTKN